MYNDNPSVVPAEAKAEVLWEGSVPEAQGRKAAIVSYLAEPKCLEGSDDVA